MQESYDHLTDEEFYTFAQCFQVLPPSILWKNALKRLERLSFTDSEEDIHRQEGAEDERECIITEGIKEESSNA